MNINEIYEQTIKSLSTADRLRLAVMILTDIPPQAIVDYRDEWSDEDYRDFSRATWMRLEQRLEDDERA
jgi:hypothetical protein